MRLQKKHSEATRKSIASELNSGSGSSSSWLCRVRLIKSPKVYLADSGPACHLLGIPAMAAPMRRLAEALTKKRPRGTRVAMFLVHQKPKTPITTEAVAPGVRALPWQEFVRQL